MTSFYTLAHCVDGCRLLAQGRFSDMGRRFRRGGSGIEWTDLVLPIAAIACVVAIAWLVSRYLKLREARRAHSPQALFAELCQAHGLDWPHQQLLLALANAYRLRSPAQLFVEPERFDVERLGSAFANRKVQVAALRSRLFAAASVGEESEIP